MTFKEARRQLLQLDEQLCTETFISNLIAYLPSKDDDTRTMEKYMKESDEKRAELDYPEQFTVEVYRAYNDEFDRVIDMMDGRWHQSTDTNHVSDSCFYAFNSGKDMNSCTRYTKLTMGGISECVCSYINIHCRICRWYWMFLNPCAILKALENC